MDISRQPVAHVPDEALLMLYANGDESAAQVLAGRLVPRILSHATRMLRDRSAAEDIAQEAMLKLWKIAPQWRQGEAKVTTWLYRVTGNLCIDRLRRKKGVALDAVPEIIDTAPSPEAALVEADRAAALRGALAKLPDRQRHAVILRHIEGLANPEIAQVMGISTEAVESLTARGKRALSALLLPRQAELGYETGG